MFKKTRQGYNVNRLSDSESRLNAVHTDEKLKGEKHDAEIKERIYLDRVVGGDCDHRNPRSDPFPGVRKSQGEGPNSQLPEQHETVDAGRVDLRAGLR